MTMRRTFVRFVLAAGVVVRLAAPIAAAAAAGIEKSSPNWIKLLEGEDFRDWRQPTGEWAIVGDVSLDTLDEALLTSKPGTGVIVNGAKGSTSHLFTKMEHGDVEAHIEFMVPKGSNSGVYFQGRYEIQVFDSWGVKELKHGDCGGIYERWLDDKGYEGRPPRVNASRQPGEWQTFDVVFRAPKFDADGKKVSNAVFVSVKHNGVVIHENQEVTGPTRAAAFEDEQPAGPLMFQGDHGPVAYANIRVRVPKGDDPFKRIVNYEFGDDREDLAAIEEAVRGASPEQRSGIEMRLLEALKSPEATDAAKQFICRMLRPLGSARSVPALAELLDNAKLSHMARYALQGIPGEQADEVLRDALTVVDGDLKIGVIGSIAARGDRKAVKRLGEIAARGNPAVARAAITALGRIGGPEAVGILTRISPPEELQRCRDDAFLVCAEGMIAEGNAAAAAAVYRKVFAGGKSPAVRTAALRGIVRSDKENALGTLLAALRGEDVRLQRAAARLSVELSGAAVTKALAAQLSSLAPDVQVILLSALADRKDKAALPAVAEAAKSENEAVRNAAIQALAVLEKL